MKLSVFIPCLNEEKIIKKNILKVQKKLNSITKSHELIIVDDGSTDSTKKIVKSMKGVKLLSYKQGRTHRENLSRSFLKAKGDTVMFMDCDLSTDLKHLDELLSAIDDGYDVATGSRYLGIQASRKISRRIISWVYNTFMRVYFGSKMQDHQCGFKAFKKPVIQKLVKDMGFNLTRGWFWDVELLVRAQKEGYKVYEFPVKWKYGKQSSFNFHKELKMIPYVLGFRFRI